MPLLAEAVADDVGDIAVVVHDEDVHAPLSWSGLQIRVPVSPRMTPQMLNGQHAPGSAALDPLGTAPGVAKPGRPGMAALPGAFPGSPYRLSIDCRSASRTNP